MGTESLEPQIKEMLTQQKVRFIQKKLEGVNHGQISEGSMKQTEVKFTNPNLLWPNMTDISPVSGLGRLVDLIPEKTIAGRKGRGIVVRMTIGDTRGNASSFYAWFGLGAVGITESGEIIVDCGKVERSGAGAQEMLPYNYFIDKATVG